MKNKFSVHSARQIKKTRERVTGSDELQVMKINQGSIPDL